MLRSITTLRVLALAILCCAGPVAAQAGAPPGTTDGATGPRPAHTLVNAAVATARAQHKNVLVYFSASWCGWCHRFADFLASPGAGKLMQDNFVIVRLDALEIPSKRTLENPGADDLLKKMSGGVNTGIPFYFVLDGSGKKIADSLIMPGHHNVGHPAQPEEVAAFVKQLETVAPKMTPAQREEIGSYLDEMAGRKG